MSNPHAKNRLKTPSQIAAEMPVPPSSLPRTPQKSSTVPPVRRNTPYLPTPTEVALLAGYPLLLVFGAVFSLLSPETRAAPYDAVRHAHIQDSPLMPSYFARKDNVFNVLFVKRGWFWITLAFVVFVGTHPALSTSPARRARAGVRWAVVTTWWVFVTQWFFGPAIIDRGFRWSGGKCEVAEQEVQMGTASAGDVFSAAACKAAGGRWSGGHDISGHVFLLVLGSFFLVQEVGWVAARWARYLREERSVVMHDGAVKGAGIEAEKRDEGVAVSLLEAVGKGGSLAAGVIGLCAWMLLMTAIYFHTCLPGCWWLWRACILRTSSPAGFRRCDRFLGFLAFDRRGILHSSVDNIHKMALKAPPNLPELVRTTFEKAVAGGHVNFYRTQVALLQVNSILKENDKKPPFNPFANPEPDLLIPFAASLLTDHILVLNKFAIVPEHFILATKSFKHQTHLLESDDLAATMACISSYSSHSHSHQRQSQRQEPEGQELFAFFNSGPASGASQAHRHVQLLPVEKMRDGISEGGQGGEWDLLAANLRDEVVRDKLPFRVFVGEVHTDMTGPELHRVYRGLYSQACVACGKYFGEGAEVEAAISYNLAMTGDIMVIMPRVEEGAEVTDEDGVAGRLALNGTVLAGTALVKTQREWDALRQDAEQVIDVLRRIGVPNMTAEAGARM
ncbi:FIT family protein scs3 [Echria macrotheca]|uniref:FIT family protein scs3 n=1 Tax=Echria macrotheca TaxID=438768 RepID=A0AAJ0FCM6_9PEZI|nr:FIT family protein scs3 [Echria macrotheca]